MIKNSAIKRLWMGVAAVLISTSSQAATIAKRHSISGELQSLRERLEVTADIVVQAEAANLNCGDDEIADQLHETYVAQFLTISDRSEAEALRKRGAILFNVQDADGTWISRPCSLSDLKKKGNMALEWIKKNQDLINDIKTRLDRR